MAVEQMLLPNGVVTRADVGRLVKETEALDAALNQAAIRGNGAELPKTSQLLDELAGLNKLNLLQPADRKRLFDFLQAARVSAPVLHMSFGADPSPVFQQGLITWIRREINPTLLLHIGLNPGIGAGAVVRTNNKYFDLSLKQHFAKKRDVLIKLLSGNDTLPSMPEPDPVHLPVAVPATSGVPAPPDQEPVA